MKRIVLAALAVSLLSAGAAARAEDSGRAAKRSDRVAARMKEKLGLSDDQADKLTAAFKAHREQVKPLFDKVRVAQDLLRQRLDEKASDKDIQASLDGLAAARAALRAQREKFETSLASILSPRQRAEMQLALARRLELARRWRGARAVGRWRMKESGARAVKSRAGESDEE